MIQVYEIAHYLCKRAPLRRIFHHVLAAFVIVLLHADVLVRSLVVNILLGDSKFFLYTQLHGQAVGIPAGLAVNLKAFHRLVTVESVFDGTG